MQATKEIYMSAASNFLENALLNHTLGNNTYTPAAGRFLALFKNTSGSALTNLEAGILTDEATGGSYVRKPIAFGAASGGTAANSATVTFDAATANWGSITHVAVMDAVTGGNVLFYGAVTTPKTIDLGDTFQVSTGNLTITLA